MNDRAAKKGLYKDKLRIVARVLNQSNYAICKRAKVRPSTLSDIINDRKKAPRLDIAFKLARSMGVSLDYLADNRRPVEPIGWLSPHAKEKQ